MNVQSPFPLPPLTHSWSHLEWPIQRKADSKTQTNAKLDTQWKTVARKAGITKRGTVHTLRHSAVYPAGGGTTQLLEIGYDIRTIQELLGHSNVQTSMIYTHVATKNMLGVKSPLDD